MTDMHTRINGHVISKPMLDLKSEDGRKAVTTFTVRSNPSVGPNKTPEPTYLDVVTFDELAKDTTAKIQQGDRVSSFGRLGTFRGKLMFYAMDMAIDIRSIPYEDEDGPGAEG